MGWKVGIPAVDENHVAHSCTHSGELSICFKIQAFQVCSNHAAKGCSAFLFQWFWEIREQNGLAGQKHSSISEFNLKFCEAFLPTVEWLEIFNSKADWWAGMLGFQLCRKTLLHTVAHTVVSSAKNLLQKLSFSSLQQWCSKGILGFVAAVGEELLCSLVWKHD